AGDSLRAGLADVLRNYQLNCLVTDLELPLAVDETLWHGWDREAVHRVFDALEFRILRERLYQYLEAVEPEAESGFDLSGALLGVATDTALAAYLARPDQRSYDLTDLALRYLQRELRVDAPDDGQLTLDGLGETEEAERNLMLRARATLDLADAINAELARDGDEAQRLLREVELPLVYVLAAMERAGIAANTEYLSELEAKFAGQVKDAAQAAYGVIGRESNLGSPKQLQEILFGELALPKTRRIKSGYTTDADALAGLLAQAGHPVLEHPLRHRDVTRPKATGAG